jgi:hypothetical protein
MHKSLLLFLILGLVLVAVLSFAQQGEQVTITTYYPSPYGVYKNLRLFPYAVSSGQACDQQGNLAYSESSNEPLYCDGQKWVALSGGGGGGGCIVTYTNLGIYHNSTEEPLDTCAGLKIIDGKENFTRVAWSSGAGGTCVNNKTGDLVVCAWANICCR